MLLVRTRIGPSAIQGTGLFAAEDIAAGTMVWRPNPIIDREITAADVAALPDVARDFVQHHTFVDEEGKMILSSDSAIYFNHSDEPNTGTSPAGNVALRDIRAGEELTENYRNLGPGFCKAFLESHQPLTPTLSPRGGEREGSTEAAS